MTHKSLTGDQAMAFGAVRSGVKVVTSYPGSPSSGTVETLIDLAEQHSIYVEWSGNEKVAVEMGTGASMAGRRVLVCVKSVGMNVIVDPLMVLNLTPVHGGLVILLGDDPGAYGSQNDQDTRPLALMLELPIMEPATPTEGYIMIQDAFILSEKYHIPVIIRETRSFSKQIESIDIPDSACQQPDLGLTREPYRFVPVPINAVEKHRVLHETMDALVDWADSTQYNRTMGSGEKGIIGAGFAYRKILDILGKEPKTFRLLKLGNLYPLPRQKIAEFLMACQDVLVVEENGPFVETHIKALAHETGSSVRIHGKKDGLLPREGEIYRWQIQQALQRFIPGFKSASEYRKEDEADEIPKKKSFCGNCRYDKVLDHLDMAAESLGQRPVIIGDPGCIVTVADRIDAKYAMGSAVAVADGVSKVQSKERAVAIFGDSSFFHTTISAICNAVHNRSDILMVVLDNKATATSGFQPNPGVGRDAFGQKTPALNIERIVRACGVKRVISHHLDDTDPPLNEVFREALNLRELTLVIVRLDESS